MRQLVVSLTMALLILLVQPIPRAQSTEPAMTFEPTTDPAFEIVQTAFGHAIGSARPMENGCELPVPTDAKLTEMLAPYRARQVEIPDGSKRFPILYCRYQLEGLTGRVIMMNPDADQIARWVVTTCHQSAVTKTELSYEQCVVAVSRMIWLQANAQFPITGIVVEPANLCKTSWSGSARFGFRHGATVGIEGVPRSSDDPVIDACGVGDLRMAPSCTNAEMSDVQLEAALTGEVVKTADNAYARLANLSRLAYSTFAPPPGRCPRPDGLQPEWLDISRDGYLAALGSNRYPLIERWIMSTNLKQLRTDRFLCRSLDEHILSECP